MGTTRKTNNISGDFPDDDKDLITIGLIGTSDGDYNVSSTDLASGLTRALDDIQDGGTILILEGSYTLTSDVFVARPVTIRGMGLGTIINTNQYRIVAANTSGGTVNDVSFIDLNLDNGRGVAIQLGSLVPPAPTSTINTGFVTGCNFTETGTVNPILSTALSAYPTTPAPTSLYLMDDGSGTTLTDSVGTNTFSDASAFPTWSSTNLPIGYSGEWKLTFNGTTHRATSTAPTSFLPGTTANGFTVEAIVRNTNITPVNRKFLTRCTDAGGSAGNGWRFGFVGTTIAAVFENGGFRRQTDSSQTLTQNVWYHLAFSWVPGSPTYQGQWNIYTNGLLTNGTIISQATPGEAFPSFTCVGAKGQTAPNFVDFWQGDIGHIAIWSTTQLTHDQIYDRYLRQLAKLDILNANTTNYLTTGNITTTTNSDL